MAVFFQRHEIVLDERLGHMSRGEDTAQGMVAFQVRGWADTGQHGGSHIAEHQNCVALLIGEVLSQLDCRCGLTAARGAPNRKNAALRFQLRRHIVFLGTVGKDTVFLKIQHHCTPLSAGASDAVLSSGS